ncbi:hypothetical protein WR25_16422 [Diploscapter pachys]|uniref:Uncharacterized protein n=1 Tax=Diploscapter pachys TaxID=2018661 RepID=A0A2A2K6V0_9BILA|nr:hypothetical protein WR25_16422 [Diploscapter pachys]
MDEAEAAVRLADAERQQCGQQHRRRPNPPQYAMPPVPTRRPQDDRRQAERDEDGEDVRPDDPRHQRPLRLPAKDRRQHGGEQQHRADRQRLFIGVGGPRVTDAARAAKSLITATSSATPTPSPGTRSGVHRAAGVATVPPAVPLAAEWTPDQEAAGLPAGPHRRATPRAVRTDTGIQRPLRAGRPAFVLRRYLEFAQFLGHAILLARAAAFADHDFLPVAVRRTAFVAIKDEHAVDRRPLGDLARCLDHDRLGRAGQRRLRADRLRRGLGRRLRALRKLLRQSGAGGQHQGGGDEGSHASSSQILLAVAMATLQPSRIRPDRIG